MRWAPGRSVRSAWRTLSVHAPRGPDRARNELGGVAAAGAQIQRHHAWPHADERQHLVGLAADVVGAIGRTSIRTRENVGDALLESVAVRVSGAVAQAPIVIAVAPSIAIEKQGLRKWCLVMAAFMVPLYPYRTSRSEIFSGRGVAPHTRAPCLPAASLPESRAAHSDEDLQHFDAGMGAEFPAGGCDRFLRTTNRP